MCVTVVTFETLAGNTERHGGAGSSACQGWWRGRDSGMKLV